MSSSTNKLSNIPPNILFTKKLPIQQTVAERLRGECLDQRTQTEVNAGHHKKPQAPYLVDVLWEEYEAGHGEHVLGNVDREGEEVAQRAHYVPLMPHPGKSVVLCRFPDSLFFHRS